VPVSRLLPSDLHNTTTPPAPQEAKSRGGSPIYRTMTEQSRGKQRSRSWHAVYAQFRDGAAVAAHAVEAAEFRGSARSCIAPAGVV
jgi:hypothetical protein